MIQSYILVSISDTAVDLARILNTCMDRNDSIVYSGFNLNVKRAYSGMVHDRRPHKRWEEHWRATLYTLQHSAHIASEKELRYEYMACHGGAASWFFLPYISYGQVIDRHRLRSLEQRILSLYPNSLNRMRHPSSLYRSVPRGEHVPVVVGSASGVHDARRKTPKNC